MSRVMADCIYVLHYLMKLCISDICHNKNYKKFSTESDEFYRSVCLYKNWDLLIWDKLKN